ncbi:MAG: hypothetical protein V1827_02510 [Candidatus Micrarchaeota archaeon]
MTKALLFYQQTPFCTLAAERAEKRFGGRLLCEAISGAGRERLPGSGPALLIWGDGTNHRLSNILNIPGSVKYVFDNHPDGSEYGDGPAYDSHNHFSRKEGVIVRVCYSAGPGRWFSAYDEREGNGMLHISTDLDFLKGFPALPWMSTGSNGLSDLYAGIGSAMSKGRLVRFDIGGYHELGEDKAERVAVLETYYMPLLDLALCAINP